MDDLFDEEQDESFPIYLPSGAEHHIMNMMYDPDRVPNTISFSYERNEEFPIEIHIDTKEYIDEDNKLFDMLYAGEVAENLAESLTKYETLYIKKESKKGLEELAKEKWAESPHQYSKTPTKEYCFAITIPLCYGESNGWDRPYDKDHFYATSSTIGQMTIKKVPQKTILHYEQLQRKKEEKEKAEQKRKQQEKEEKEKRKREEQERREQYRKEEEEKEERLNQPYSLEDVLKKESTKGLIHDLQETVHNKEKVLLYTTVGLEDEAFFDQDGEFISLVYANDAMFRSEYHSGLFSHFGVDVEYVVLPKEIDERIEHEQKKEDLYNLVEKYVAPFLAVALKKK